MNKIFTWTKGGWIQLFQKKKLKGGFTLIQGHIVLIEISINL
jgi:hypothetical protein